MRLLIPTALKAAEPVTDEVGQRIYQSSSLGVGDVPAKPEFPYILFTELPSTPYRVVRETSRASARHFQVYVYDERGSYVRIERILGLVRETLLSLVTTVSPSGARCTDVEWTGDSMDLVDPSLNANSKFASFRFTSSQ